MNKKWYIKDFDDYHSIRSDTHKAKELGCYPVANYGYYRYFGLFYNGPRPPLADILNVLKKRITFGDFYHVHADTNIGIDKEDLAFQVKESLKS